MSRPRTRSSTEQARHRWRRLTELTSSLTVTRVLVAGALLRAVLLLVCAWQDATLDVRYTDIDFDVIMDGARHVAKGGSPYTWVPERGDLEQYRYTPLLALLFAPTVAHPTLAKATLCAADLGAAVFLGAAARHAAPPSAADQSLWRNVAMIAWLFNPFTATISTRGSPESLVALMLAGALALLLPASAGRPTPADRVPLGRAALAGALYGLAVHWRLYPVIYALPTVLYFARRGKAVLGLVTLRGAVFGVAAALAAGCATLGCYVAYGGEFLHATYFYHSSRRDPQHNFSVYFYPTWLTMNADVPWLPALDRWAFLPQLAATAAVGVAWRSDLVWAWLLQTVVFVALNKVITAQYFVWWFLLLPAALPKIADRTLTGRAVATWAAAQLHWLLWAYVLEFRGVEAVRPVVWIGSLLLLCAHCYLVWALVRSYDAGAVGNRRKRM
ncbi:unnamed protein product [Pedinophyceae sp. YPF-701]|nr:unnamed protein product [Pedinophyceae sp. YPF-701]